MGLFKRIMADKQEQSVTTKQQIGTPLSQRDPIEKLNLMEHSFNALTHAGVQTVGELLKLVESGELRAIHGLRSTSILEIEVKLAQLEIVDNSEFEANPNATPDQNDVPLSRKVPIEKANLTQSPPNQLHVDSQTVREVKQQVESGESATISESDANVDTMPDQNDASLSQEDATEEPSLPQHSPNPLIHTESQTVGEGIQHVESAESQTISEDDANTDTMPDQNSVSLSREDSIEKLSLTRHTLNLLKHADIRTVGDLLQWVESGRLQTIPALGRISILEIEDELARINSLDDSGVEANLGATPNQNDVSFSREDSTEEPSLPQHSPNPHIHTESQTVGEDTQHIESVESQTISEAEVNVDAIPDQNEVPLSQEDSTEEPSMTEHSPNPPIHTESQTVGEDAQQIKSSELQTIVEGEADTNETLDQNDPPLSRKDSTKRIRLTRDALNRLKHTDVRTVGQLLQWVESGKSQTTAEAEADTNETPDQNDVSPSREDSTEKQSLTEHSPNPLIHTDSQTVGEDTQHIESSELQTIAEAEADTDETSDQNDVSLSREDPIEKLRLTQYALNRLKHTDIRTVGELLQWVESDTTPALGQKSILKIKERLVQAKTLDGPEIEANTNEASDQNDASLSREASTEEQSLTQHTDLQTIREDGQQVESSKLLTISEVEADTDAISEQDDILSQEDSAEEPSLTVHAPNPRIDTDSQTVGEAAQQVESGEYQTTSEIEANTNAIPSKDDVSLSREDSIKKLNLTEYSFNALTALGVQTVGEVLELVASGEHRPISTLGRKFILEIEGKLARVKILDDSETEANTDSQATGEVTQHVESSEIQTIPEGEANVDAIPDQNDILLSREDSTKEPSLPQHSPNLPEYTESQMVGEVTQHVESSKIQTISGDEANINTTPNQNDTYLSRGDTIEKLSLSQRCLNALKNADIWVVGELLQLVELGRLRAIRGLGHKSISEIEKRLAQVRIHDNYAYLSKEDSIEQLNLRNRSFNAFTRAGIQTIGEVLKLVESGELQTIPSLGRKSILEVKIKLAQVKIHNDSDVEANTDAMPDRDYGHLSLEDPIDWLYLTPRSFNMLMRANIQTIGELLQLVEPDGLKIVRGLGRKSILEIKEKLIQAKFLNDSEVGASTDAIPSVVIRWQSELVNKQLLRGLLHEDAIIAEKSIKDWLAETETVESNRVYEVLATILGSSLNICEGIEFFLNQIPGQYRMTVLLSTYGLEPKNLRQTGDELGLSRERVRQIRNELKDQVTSLSKLKARPALLRMQSALFIARDLGLNITYEQWTQRIRSSGLVGDWKSENFVGTDAVEAMIAICNLLADCKIRCLQMPENLQYAVQLAIEGKPNVPAKIPHARDILPDAVKRLINRHAKFSGGVHVKWLSQENNRKLEEVKDILQGLGYRALSKDWFAPHQISYSDVFHRCLRQMFQYCGPLGIDDICAGIRHGVSRSGFSEPEHLVSKGTVQSRSVFPVPPPDVMDEILRIGGYQFDNELYYWDSVYDEKLNTAENIIMNCLEQIGPVLHHSELVHAFIERELSLPALSAALNSSPLFDKVESGLYKLRGKEVTYQDIERAKAAGKPQSLRPEIEYDTEGNIIVRVTLSAIAVGSGTILCERFPDLSGANWECYVNGEEAGELNAVENEFRRLRKPFELLNCQPGDRVKFTFNTWERTVEIEKVEENAKS